MIRVFCKNTGTFKEFQEGTMLLEMIDEFDFEKPYPIIAALVNNVPQGLKFRSSTIGISSSSIIVLISEEMFTAVHFVSFFIRRLWISSLTAR